jgi:DNA-directed RNA polymerase specialized sigma24 family protein
MDIIRALAVDWERVLAAPTTLRRYRRWQAEDERIRRWSDLRQLVRFAQRRGDPAGSDAALTLLAGRAPKDSLAARALLHAIEPGLRALVVQHYWLTDEEDLYASAIAIAWDRIRTYPFDARPRRVAANVLRDTSHRLRRAYPRQLPTAGLEPADRPLESEHRKYDSIALLDLANRSVDPTGLAVVLRTRVHGESVASLAAEMQCSVSAIRERRRRAEVRLRAAIVRSDRLAEGSAS